MAADSLRIAIETGIGAPFLEVDERIERFAKCGKSCVNAAGRTLAIYFPEAQANRGGHESQHDDQERTIPEELRHL